MATYLNLQVSPWVIQASQECYDQRLSKPYKLAPNEPFPSTGTINGAVIQRPNHGLANSIRKICFIPLLVELFEQGGIRSFDFKGQNFSIRDQIENIQIATLFSAAGRESEASHTDDPKQYANFRKTSSELYLAHVCSHQYRRAYGRLLKTGLGGYYRDMINDPYSNPTDAIYKIFRIARNLDLQRCYNRGEFKSTLNDITSELEVLGQTKEALQAQVNSLKAFATQCLVGTGDQNFAENTGRNPLLFVVCSTFAKSCFEAIGKVPIPTFTAQSESSFKTIDSSQLVPLESLVTRDDFAKAFAKNKWALEKVLVAKSDFVSNAFAEHLLRDKKDSALGIKYVPGDKITWMEGALHTFVTAICPITLSGDPTYAGRHTISPFQNRGRRIVLSTTIQPDFELSADHEVVMKIVEIRYQPVAGVPLNQDAKPLSSLCKTQEAFNEKLPTYEKTLKQHMIFHLTKGHRLPSLNEVKGHVLALQPAKELLESMIRGETESDALINQFAELNRHVVSLEVLFNLYLNQLAPELGVLEKELPQGFIYTMDPPSIFARQIGTNGVELLNRVQILALKEVKKTHSLNHLRCIGFNSYLDPQCLDLLKIVFPEKDILPKSALFKDGYYADKRPFALVLHNNSDAFGQNIETEGPTSLDGVIGSFSDASIQLNRTRPDLFENLS